MENEKGIQDFGPKKYEEKQNEKIHLVMLGAGGSQPVAGLCGGVSRLGGRGACGGQSFGLVGDRDGNAGRKDEGKLVGRRGVSLHDGIRL